jgi:polyketide biosynthesis acyl carrier protein
MTKEQIFDVLKSHLVEILPDLDPSSIGPGDSMKDLGANSIDRTDVVIQTMESLGVKMPLHELSGASNLQQLADLLYERSN